MSQSTAETIASALRVADNALEANAPSLAEVLRALRKCQTGLDVALRDNQLLSEENAALIAAQSLRAPTSSASSESVKGPAWITHPALFPYAKILISLAKKVTFYHEPWVFRTAMGRPRPVFDPNVDPDLKYQSPEETENYLTYVLYTECPPGPDNFLHQSMEKMPAFASAIMHQCSAGRSAMISTLRDNVQIIFDSYNHIQPSSVWGRDRKSRDMTQFRKLLSFNPDPTQINDDSPLKADTYPPLMYAGLIKHTSNAFRHPALIKTGRLVLFGNTSIINPGTIPGSNGQTWGRQSNLVGLISLTITLATFFAAGDRTFGTTGSESQIPYQADYIARKRTLDWSAVHKPDQYNALMEFWQRELYAGLSEPSGTGQDSESDASVADRQAAEMLAIMGDDLDDEDPGSTISSGSTISGRSSNRESPVPTLPPTPILARTGVLVRNEPLLYPDLDASNEASNISSRGRLSRESTVRVFAPGLSPSASMILSAPTPTISATNNQGDPANNPEVVSAGGNDIAIGIEGLSINPPTEEGSASGRGRTTGARGRRNGAAAESRPTRSGTRTRKATARS